MKINRVATLATGLFLAISTSTSFAQAIIVAPPAPPPPRVEIVPTPRVGYVWVQGHWKWRHGAYHWVEGRWRAVASRY
ncbi:hypothetical protein CY652_23200 [Burkholderia sp. WAC0059]|uniref:YXWGXW repeat-containing protein n=1 Tax=Burkholderia sp. WAC0059 TaxID=2066022 RepID=UPI000C7EC831|nr:hypothetical protein CY652_23200 [Burkholderia sp. WAC0059]